MAGIARKILVVDDEDAIVSLVRKYLQAEGFAVEGARDGREALTKIAGEEPDLVLLDVMLPGIDGLDVLREIRISHPSLPVIMLTARAEEADKLVGLGLGADDYVTKPFSLRELNARIKAVLRRCGRESGPKEKPVRVGDVFLDPEAMVAQVRGEKVEFTKAEFKILYALLSRPGRVFSREELLEEALGEAYRGYARTIDTHIWSIRRKVEKDPANPEYVLTVYGVGYKGRGPSKP